MGKRKHNASEPIPEGVKSRFQTAVEATPDIADCYMQGLNALKGNHKAKIILTNPRDCEGSVDIDACTTAKYPQESRWDYVIGYEGKAYFVEVHGALTSEVSAVEKKLIWLKQWLETTAPELKVIKAAKPYFWIQSDKFDIPSHLPQYKRVVQLGLRPIPKLTLPPK